MLLEKSELVYGDLAGNAALTALLTNGANSIRPLIAEFEDGDVFVTYNIQFNGYTTKGNRADLRAEIFSWSKDYNTSLRVADAVETALDESNHYSAYESANTFRSEEDIFYTRQIFNIKN